MIFYEGYNKQRIMLILVQQIMTDNRSETRTPYVLPDRACHIAVHFAVRVEMCIAIYPTLALSQLCTARESLATNYKRAG